LLVCVFKLEQNEDKSVLYTKIKQNHMKKSAVLLSFFVLLFTVNVLEAQNTEKLTTSLFNVNCNSQAAKQKIEKMLSHQRGIVAYDVNVEQQTVGVTFDTRKNSNEKLLAALKNIGFVSAIRPSGCCAKSKDGGMGECKKPCGAEDCGKH
jgi:copper chaperone CopZ